MIRFRLIKEFLRRNMKAVDAIATAMLKDGDVDGPDVERIVRDNAEFAPEDELHVALAEMLTEEERMRFASNFSENLAKIDSRGGEKSGRKDENSAAPAQSQEPESEDD